MRIVDINDITIFPNVGLGVKGPRGAEYLILKPGSALTENRILTLRTGDIDRIVTLLGNPTLSDWFNQGVKTTDTPTFLGIILAGGSSFKYVESVMVGNETFSTVTGNVFYKDGGAADRTFNPAGVFLPGFFVFLHNQGLTKKITFDSTVLNQDVFPGESAVFFYSGAIWRLFTIA